MKREDYDITGRALSKPRSLLHPCSQKHKRKPIQTQNKHCAALDLCSGEQRTCGNLRYDLQQGCALLRNNLSPYGTDHPNLYGLYQKFSASISTALDYSFTITSDLFYCVIREFRPTHIIFLNKVLFSSLIIFIRSHMSTIILRNAYCKRACLNLSLEYVMSSHEDEVGPTVSNLKYRTVI